MKVNGATTPTSMSFIVVVFQTGHDDDGQSPATVSIVLWKVAVNTQVNHPSHCIV